jgi:hypothetical protein
MKYRASYRVQSNEAWLRFAVPALLGIGAVALAIHVVRYFGFAKESIFYPFQLDYGEGIVWQQMAMIPGPTMYGDITRYPFIVCNYPPLYYLAVRSVSPLFDNPLLAGRAVSFACTIGLIIPVGVIAFRLADGGRDRFAAFAASAVAGLSLFCCGPIVDWSVLMRVDMLATLLTFCAVALMLPARRSTWMPYLAAVLFVAAMYTKQTSIAAPAALYPVLWLTDRRLAIRSAVAGLVVGLVPLIWLEWVTDGGFLRHIVSYNVNRFDPLELYWQMRQEARLFGFVVLAAIALVIVWPRHLTLRAVVAVVRSDRTMALRAALSLYFLTSGAMLVTLGKSGANKNYMIEWACVACIWTGVLIAHVVRVTRAATDDDDPVAPRRSAPLITAVACATLFAIQVAAAKSPVVWSSDDPAYLQSQAALEQRIAAADKPVLSDNMVLLRLAGKDVPWEPAIFAELGSLGRWDQHLITDRIAQHRFAFIVTTPGVWYAERFNPVVDQAISRYYPHTENFAGTVVHTP